MTYFWVHRSKYNWICGYYNRGPSFIHVGNILVHVLLVGSYRIYTNQRLWRLSLTTKEKEQKLWQTILHIDVFGDSGVTCHFSKFSKCYCSLKINFVCNTVLSCFRDVIFVKKSITMKTFSVWLKINWIHF